jgi:hypothetical protein
MGQRSDLSNPAPPTDREPSERDASANTGDAPDVPMPYEPPEKASGGFRFDELGDQIVWLLAGALIIGFACLGGILFLILNSGEEAKPARTPTSEAAYATPIPTATHTPTATGTPTPIPTVIPTASITPKPSSTPTVTPTPTPTPDVILLGVQALGELNTVQYELKTVVEKEAQQKGPLFLRPGLHFLMVAEGRVKAGVDFADMVRYDIVEGKVTIYLPAPRIMEYSIDPQSLRL